MVNSEYILFTSHVSRFTSHVLGGNVIKKILIPILIIALLGGSVFVIYTFDFFSIRHRISSFTATIPYVSKALGLDVRYVVTELKHKKYGDKKIIYEIYGEEDVFKDTVIENKNRYVFNPQIKKASSEDKNRDFNYPSTGKKEYTPEKLEELAQIYSAMEPEQAVPILQQFDDDVIIAVFSNMKKEIVAEILSAFDPKRAGTISIKMLENGKKSATPTP